MSYAKNPATQVFTIIDENNYCPFGLKHKEYNDYVATSNKYEYNGKELQDELGLNTYDYGARIYTPDAPRFWQIDPLAEKGRRWSPYAYAFDNPVYFIDPDGMWPDNPITGLINRATTAVKNYVVNKVSTVVSNTRNILSHKASIMLDKITPDIKIGKAEKAQKAFGFGVSFTTEGGKQGGMVSDQAGRDTPQVDMSVIVGLTDVYGPPTTVPGVVPDGSNPFVKSPDGGDEVKSEPTMKTESSEVQISVPKVTLDASGNGSRSATKFFKDTIVNKKDSARVTNEAKNIQQNDIKNFNKKYGTDF
ncbi:RHS repeat-associated core domain-containing protein [Flavobacterium sp. N502540]|uniref:RHS repeat-associated core domain-containing protein n=1 Tax=Flavobacterium sp. N502540 TaxID=2986838 RepID=UPI0022257EFA|nr:RHS repeat-associated core domain-containing protein [Flavobacterium sp. N502540]